MSIEANTKIMDQIIDEVMELDEYDVLEELAHYGRSAEDFEDEDAARDALISFEYFRRMDLSEAAHTPSKGYKNSPVYSNLI